MHLALPPPIFSIVGIGDDKISAYLLIRAICFAFKLLFAFSLITKKVWFIVFLTSSMFPAKLFICAKLISIISFPVFLKELISFSFSVASDILFRQMATNFPATHITTLVW